MVRITNLKLSLDEALDIELELENLRKLICQKYKLRSNQLVELELFKKAIDARKKQNVHFVYTVDVKTSDDQALLRGKSKNVTLKPNTAYLQVQKGIKKLHHRPVIIGFGPSGIFAALLLAQRGYKPIVLERGYDVKKRSKEWNEFIKTGYFKENASVLFGEGGAGTFSDGKLTTSVKNIRCRFVLEELIRAGAQKEILYSNKPHIGTDVLRVVIKNIRQRIIDLGGEIRFESKVTDFIIEDGALKGLEINHKEVLRTDVCLLGIGHSARDTFELLYQKGLSMDQKPFSVGVRIEHKQEMINRSQYGEFHNHPALGAAEYKLNYHGKNGRSAYTFCMCPGGFVVNSSSEAASVATNGMSYSKRSGDNANAALLVNVTPDDFPGEHPLAGIEFQRFFEKKAYELAGYSYKNPLQLVGDFLEDKISSDIGSVVPTIQPGYSFVKMQDIYPKYITNTLREALLYFDKRIKGFASKDAVLTGPETRSSSPVKILREANHQTSVLGLYAMGEGPGYAGGIMSAAVDGIKTAEEIIKEFNFDS